jgi:hypothetical protein
LLSFQGIVDGSPDCKITLGSTPITISALIIYGTGAGGLALADGTLTVTTYTAMEGFSFSGLTLTTQGYMQYVGWSGEIWGGGGDKKGNNEVRVSILGSLSLAMVPEDWLCGRYPHCYYVCGYGGLQFFLATAQGFMGVGGKEK